MIYKTEKDILEIRKWCDGHELLKCNNYVYQNFDCNETRLRINYFVPDTYKTVYFILHFSKDLFNKYSKYGTYHPIFLLSDVIMEIRNKKLEFLLK